jgi:hypothetical protein
MLSTGGVTGGLARTSLGANRGSATLGAPAVASSGNVTVTANARLRAATQSRQIFAPGGHSRPQILHLIDPPLPDRNSGHALDFLADPYLSVDGSGATRPCL